MWLSLVSAFLLISTLHADNGACSKWVHNSGGSLTQGGYANTHPNVQKKFITTRSVTFGDGPFFAVNYGGGFDVPEAPQIMATIERAAKIWAGAFDNPVVHAVFNFEIAPLGGNIHGLLQYGFRYETYDGFITTLRNQDNKTKVEPWQSMVDTAESLNGSIHWNPGNIWWYNTLGVTGPMWSAATGQPDSSASTFTIYLDSGSLSLYDFDTTDGTAPGKYDFLTTIVHQMAHPLGFLTVVEPIDQFGYGGGYQFLMFIWDLMRFSDAEINFATTQRNMDPGAAHHYFWDKKLPSSIELSRGSIRAGADAGHWINSNLTDVIGIMDPSLMDGQQIGISPADLSVLDAIGWKLRSPMIPLLDSFILNTDSTKPSVKVMGYLMTPSVVCSFNGVSTAPVTPSDTLASNSWRGVTCALPSTLKFNNKKIYVQVSNDGKVWSTRMTLWDPLVTAVLPLPIPLINLTGPSISMMGRAVFLESSKYYINFEGTKLSTMFINSSALTFNTQFTSKNAPVNNRRYAVAVMNSTWTSNQIDIYFQYQPVIGTAFVESKQLKVYGQYFGTAASCEYRTKNFVTPATVYPGNGLSCALPSQGVTTPFGIRVIVGDLASNWFTVVN